MKIARIEASAHSRPFEGEVLRNALGANVKRDFVLVKVTADDGTVGYGEAHHGQNPTAMAEIIRNGIGTLLAGADPIDTEGIWERVRRQQVQTHGLGAGSVIALSGIDIALWDLKGKAPRAAGLPAPRRCAQAPARLRGRPHPSASRPPTRSRRRSGSSSTAATPRSSSGSGIPRSATRSGSRGCGASSGTSSTSRWTPRPAIPPPTWRRWSRTARTTGCTGWRSRFAPDAIGAYRDLAERTLVPLAAGEKPLHPGRRSGTFWKRGRCPSCRPTAPRPAASRRSRRSPTWPPRGTSPPPPTPATRLLSAAANVHLLCALGNGLIYEADEAPVNPFRTDLARNPLEVRDGCIEPHDAPGLGLDIDEAMLADYPAVPGPCYLPGR